VQHTICSLIGKFSSGLQRLGEIAHNGMHITIVYYYVTEKRKWALMTNKYMKKMHIEQK
jgi:hypothetical protein